MMVKEGSNEYSDSINNEFLIMLVNINISGESGTVRHTQKSLKFSKKRIFFEKVSKKSPSF
jgi:hypothetical protein